MSPSPKFANEIERLMRDPYALRPERQGDHYDRNQPRVPAGNSKGGQWTSGGSSGDHSSRTDISQSSIQQARLELLRRPIQRGIQRGVEAALALFAALSARNTSDERAVIEFNAREFKADDAHGQRDQAKVALLNRSRVNEACPRLEEVQARTDHATDVIDRSGMTMSRQQFGTAVHVHLKRQIDALDDPNFRAEVSRLKSEFEEVRHGTRGSIRIDVLENAGGGTVCVYDIKTGASGLSAARMGEIARSAFKHYPNTRRIIVSEIRPRR